MMAKRLQLSTACIMLIMATVVDIGNNIVGAIGGWDNAHATFYGDIHGGDTMNGACGYGDLHKQCYGLQTTALSEALFNGGQTCGACFEIKCVDAPQWCLPGSIKVTATNFCPSSTGPQAWCNPPLKHFDLSMKMFLQIAKYKAGIVPVQFQRVPCVKRGGIKFQLNGNPNFLLVLVYNVGGAGDVVNVQVKGSKTGWIQMSRNWGQNWQTGVVLVGQGLSFRVTTSDGRTVEADAVVPSSWKFKQTFEAKANF